MVLFDEVDKAHPDVLTVLLQLFDEVVPYSDCQPTSSTPGGEGENYCLSGCRVV